MPSLALVMVIISVATLISHFFGLTEKIWLVYQVIYPLVSMLAFLGFYFYSQNERRKSDLLEYKDEITRLKQELNRTKKRVAAGVTTISFPKEGEEDSPEEIEIREEMEHEKEEEKE